MTPVGLSPQCPSATVALMMANLKGWIGRVRATSSAQIAKDYGSLSTDERSDVNRLREEHRFGNTSPDRDFPSRPGT